MNKVANHEIRESLKKNGIRQWELAEAMGISEWTLVRRLRKEVSPDCKQTMMNNISFLAGMKNGGMT